MAGEQGVIRISSPNKPTNCDIVFVHGLLGDADKTWRHSETEYWPAWVDQDNPRAAVWALSYDASPSAWFGRSMTIYERAKNLLATMNAHCIGHRPLAFVCHSLGGLLVKRMLELADLVAREEFPHFLASTRLIVFVATPHAGAAIATIADRFREFIRNTELLEELRRESIALIQSNEWFMAHCRRSSLKVLSFYETARFKHFVTVVDRASADCGVGFSVPTSCNHSEISKPKRADLVATHAQIYISKFTEACSGDHTDAARVFKNRPVLRFESIVGIDPACIPELLNASGAPELEYHHDISTKIDRLRSRHERPDEHARQRKAYRDAHSHKRREEIAVAFSFVTDMLLFKVQKQEAYHKDGLRMLLAFLNDASTNANLADKALKTFAALSALLMIRELKQGGDYESESDARYAWFDSYSFSDDSPSLFKRVPEWDHTGNRVFGYGRWVTARVGAGGERYEAAMVPLEVVLDCFESYETGGPELFYQWILPQLFILYGCFWGVENFPSDDYRVHVLTGFRGKEWSSFSACPWPGLRLHDRNA